MGVPELCTVPHLTVEKNIASACRCATSPRPTSSVASRRASHWSSSSRNAKKLRPGSCPGASSSASRIGRRPSLEPRLLLMGRAVCRISDAKLRLEMRSEIRRLHQSLGPDERWYVHPRPGGSLFHGGTASSCCRGAAVQQIGTPDSSTTARPTGTSRTSWLPHTSSTWTSTAVNGSAVTVSDQGFTARGTAVQPATVSRRCALTIRPEEPHGRLPHVARAGRQHTTPRLVVGAYRGRFALRRLTPGGPGGCTCARTTSPPSGSTGRAHRDPTGCWCTARGPRRPGHALGRRDAELLKVREMSSPATRGSTGDQVDGPSLRHRLAERASTPRC